jgi:hypothetical protein
MQGQDKNVSRLVSVIYLYMITVMFALPYYNWRYASLSDHPKPAIYDHLKTGHMETSSGTLTTA